jgi:hypothetical protein
VRRSSLWRRPGAGPAGRLLFATLALVGWSIATTRGHEIPNDVTIRMFVRPEGQRLRVLVRAPLEAMTDIDWRYSGPGGLLDLTRIDANLEHAATLWLADNIDARENGARLAYPRVAALRASLPNELAFQSYDEALAQLLGPPLPPATDLYRNQGILDALFEYDISSDRSAFAVHARFARLGIQTLTILRFLPPGGAMREFNLHGDQGLVPLEPRWTYVVWRFVRQGFLHILQGADHVLFLFCLVIPLRSLAAIVLVATSFTIAHSITLIAAAYELAPGALWFPPLVDALVATSILYMAIENLVGPRLERRWPVAFVFGLAHGFSFSLALRDTLQFAGAHLFSSLVSFNVGIEAGQLLLLGLLVPALRLAFRFVVAERIGTILVSVLVAHTGWHWVTTGYGRLLLFPLALPTVDAAFLAATLRWLMLLVVAAGAGWAISTFAGGRRVNPEGGGLPPA